jgi:hypothetical protein
MVCCVCVHGLRNSGERDTEKAVAALGCSWGVPDKVLMLVQLLLLRGTNLTKAAKSVETLIKKGALRPLSYVFRDANLYEHEVGFPRLLPLQPLRGQQQ